MSGRTALYWARESVFRDNQTGDSFDGPGAFEIPAEEEAHYRRRGWTDIPDDYDGDVEQPSDAAQPNRDEPTREELRGTDPEEVDAVDTSSGADTEESEFDANAVLEGTVDDVEARIQDGAADGHLDELAEAADRQGVLDAIQDRQESG